MSAINPASFASPSLGLQAPSGIGPGAVGVSRAVQSERRPQPTEQPTYGAPQAGRGYQGGFSSPFASALDRGPMSTTAFQASTYTYGYSPFAAAPRNVVSPGGFVQMDPFAAYAQTTDYQSMPNRFPSPHVTPTQDQMEFGRNGQAQNDTWINNFHGLSMGSR
jgi:hypothetical protein